MSNGHDKPTEPAGRPHILSRPGLPSIAYERHRGEATRTGIFFLSGYGSSGLDGEKARFLAALASERGQSLLRFDYSGHGRSEGLRDDGNIEIWLAEALEMFDRETEGPQLLVGSSMGGWLSLLTAQRRPERVAGLVLIAPAPDFTEALMWAALSESQRERVMSEGEIRLPSPYLEGGMLVSRKLIEAGRRHLLLGGPIGISAPVRILQGMADTTVPWRHAMRLVDALAGRDVRLVIVKDGDHRLSRPEDLALLRREIVGLTP